MTGQIEEPYLLKFSEAARKSNVSLRTFKKWVKEQRFPVFRDSSNLARVRWVDVQRSIDERIEPGRPA